MRDNPHATFLAHDCIPLKTKVELLTVRKNVNVEHSAIEVGLQRDINFKVKHLFNALNMLSALRLTNLTCWETNE